MSKPIGGNNSAGAGQVLSRIALSKNFTLLLCAPTGGDTVYPTDRLQKGWLLTYRNEVLTEEGAGFGMPMVKYGLLTVFPGEAQVATRASGNVTEIRVNYLLNLVERLSVRRQSSIKIPAFYQTRELFSTLHRHSTRLRRSLNVLFAVTRSVLKLQTTFEPVKPVGSIVVSYLFRHLERCVTVIVELDSFERARCTQIIVVNEQGACFDHYQDSSGTALSGETIGSWDEVQASQASLSDVRHHIAFGVEEVAEARLFRGREQKAKRLAWGGLNYVMAPSVQRFAYEIRLEKERG